MSAPAIKSSMPGVGTPTASTGHTMLPMNMVAQKVVPSADQQSGGMKPLQGTNLNYVTLQPPTQPLSLIQEHRAPNYQTPFSNNIPTDQQQQQQQQPSQQQQLQQPSQPPQQQSQPQPQQPIQHKEVEQQQDTNKLVQNGTEQSKVEKDKHDGIVPLVPTATATPASSTTGPIPTSTPATSVPSVPTNVTPALAPVPSSVTNATSTPTAVTAVTATSAPPAPSAAGSTTIPAVTAPVPVPAAAATKPATTEPPKVNSSSVDGPVSSEQQRHLEPEVTQKLKEESTPAQADQVPVPIVQNKVEEKKSPIASGPKEETTATPATPAATSPQKALPVTPKPEEPLAKAEAATPLQKSPKTPAVKSESPEKLEAKTPISSRPAKRKPRELKEPKVGSSEGGPRSRRNRTQTTPYQSPLPEMAAIVKNLSKPSVKGGDDKLIVFYKNEFLAVRNTEGSFYVCQAMQNIYKSSKRIRIRWLSQDQNNGEIYSPDFYDHTDFDCILTNLNLNKVEKNKYQLTKYELLRTENILKRAIDVEAGVSEKPRVTEEHPDGIDLSIYKDEAQLKKRKGKGKGKASKGKRQRKKANKDSSESDDDDEDESDEDEGDSDESDDSDSSEQKSSPGRKSGQSKKRAGSKAVISLTPATPKGPSRAERALNRSKGPVGPSTSGISSSTPGTASKKAAEPKKATEPKKVAEVKKTITKPVANATTTPGQSRVKPRSGAAAQTPTQETKTPAGGRPKRVTNTTTVTPSSSEEGPSRKKPRGRA